MAESYRPEGYQNVVPYLVVENAELQIDFLTSAFHGDLIEKIKRPDGGVMHAEVRIGDCVVMMGQAREGQTKYNAMLYLYVEDTDTTYQSALTAGASSVMEPADKFYGDRNAAVRDSQGNEWWLATHKENMSIEEIQKRADAQEQNTE